MGLFLYGELVGIGMAYGMSSWLNRLCPIASTASLMSFRCWRSLGQELVVKISTLMFRRVRFCWEGIRRSEVWCLVTPGNHSMNSSTVAPSFRLLKRAATGTLVPLNTQAPLTLAGLLSMAGHVLQLFMVITCVVRLR